jgi:hypothetical protein
MKQSEAMRLANELDAYHTAPHHKQAAAELRRLSEALAAQPVQEPDHSDELTIAYLSGVARGKELAAQDIERLVALARADERNSTWTQEHWTEYERSIAEAEREACAKVCEEAISSIWEFHPEYVNEVGRNVCTNLAAAIRARGNT